MIATMPSKGLTGPDDPRHGTPNGYNNHRCRCGPCREANRVSHAEYMQRIRAEETILGRHGTSLCYDSGCRCDVCRESHNARSRQYKRTRRAVEQRD
ncbi:Uncharacterised protein [Mycobacteroides abscessus subsp. abscessus]|nr:Uncharacterised protein [Mycobacteroides abscessus subsp. abscessus]SIC59533.1 Uncharacterised protein [Mycobacteroides abscessus subsp. abscessus]SKK20279.1 Uncharacterised protein [Mycobacteroides abscessus subsp. abscessus]SKP50096.1 Uncharacterised protein [Mycobacteroides abscessus subsp. abscessus]